MRDNGPAVNWYRNRIHQKQRKTNRLSIEVGLEAQDNEDAGALAETLECLDTAIAILEQAKVVGNVAAEARDTHGEDELVSPPQLMDDIGHSMAPLDLVQPYRDLNTVREGDPSPFRDPLSPSACDWPSGVLEDSLRFFE
jgi:hypothetical protein